jgi:type I restriction enzyme S subunit
MPAPPGWCWVALEQVARLESGHTPSRKFTSYWDGGIPWIGIKDARNHHGKKIFETLQTVSQEGLDNSAARLLPEGTVCLSRTASVGYALVMGAAMATSQDFVNWICSDAVDPEFLMHLFIAEKESLLRFGKGTTHTTIYYPEVKALHVCLPPKRQQRAIVEAIESYFTRLDDAAATLERVQRNLKRYRASVLKAAVEGRLVPTEASVARAEGRDYEPTSVLLERILAERRRRWEEAELAKLKAKGKAPKDDKWKARYKEPVAPDTGNLPTLPEGWEWATLDQLLMAIEAGKSFRCVEQPPEPSEVGVVKVSSVTWGRFDEDESKTCTRPGLVNADYFIQPGDFLISRANTIDLVGAVVIVGALSRTLMLSDKTLRLRTVGGLERWLLWVLRSSHGRREIEGLATGNQDSMRNIGQASIRRIRVPLPPQVEVQRIVEALEEKLSTADDGGELLCASEARCSRLRQSILKWAFEGRLVDQDPTDEPASQLLERIRAERESTNSQPRRSARRPRAKAPKA